MKQYYVIPDHSPAALAEEFETALFSLAFQRLEEEELKMMQSRIKAHPRATGRQAQFVRRLSRRLRRERSRALVLHALPRVAQAAACLIAVLSIGAGVALAASQEVRSWAAGVLTGTPLEEETQFFGEASYERIEDGTVIGDQLILMESDGELTLRSATGAEPSRYVWADQGTRRLCRLEEYEGEIYALYEIGREDDPFDGEPAAGAVRSGWGSFERIGLGRLRLAQDGTFTVEELTDFDAGILFDSQGRRMTNGSVSRIAAGGGKLYFTTVWEVRADEFGFGSERFERLFACDLATGELTELASPLEGVASPGYRLFSDETVYVGVENPMRIFRIESDGSYTPMAEFAMGEGANSYAYRASNDTFYYQLGAAIYAAEHFNIAGAKRVALSSGNGGRGFLIGENSYGIIIFNGVAEIFDLDAEPTDVNELATNFGTFMDESLRAAYPNLTLVSDPADTHDENYVEKILAGETEADLIWLDEKEYLPLHKAGYGKAIADETVCAAIDSMPAGMRAFASRDGEYIALPNSLYPMADVVVNETLWREMGFGELPETWLDLLNFMAELSHSGDASDYYLVGLSYFEGTPLQQMVMLLVQGYARSWATQGVAPDFGGEEFAQALAALREIDFDALNYEDGAGGDNGPYEQFLLSFDFLGYTFHYHNDFAPDERNLSLTVHPGDPRYSDTYVDMLLIDPKSEKEETALSYMRWKLSNTKDRDRWLYDFTTPAEELADRPESIESIQIYRGEVGDMFVPPWGPEEREKLRAAFTSYARGEIDFASLAARLNEIYAA